MRRLVTVATIVLLMSAVTSAMEFDVNELAVESSTSYRNKFVWHGYHVADDTFV